MSGGGFDVFPPFGGLTFGTPPSPSVSTNTKTVTLADLEKDIREGRVSRGLEWPTPPPVPPALGGPQRAPIVTIRQAGERGAELYVCTSAGARFVVPLSWGHLVNIIEDAAAGLRRLEKE